MGTLFGYSHQSLFTLKRESRRAQRPAAALLTRFPNLVGSKLT